MCKNVQVPGGGPVAPVRRADRVGEAWDQKKSDAENENSKKILVR